MGARLAQMRDAAADQGLRQFRARGDAQAAVVAPGALSLFRDIERVVGGIVDEARDDLAVALQRDRDREHRDRVQEIGGAVERIDVPGVGLVRALDTAALLHHEAVAGAGLGQFLEQDLFRALVGEADEIAGTLGRDLQVLEFAQIALEPAPGLDGGGCHDIHKGGADHSGGPSVGGAEE